MRKVIVDGVLVRVRTAKERNPRKAKNPIKSSINYQDNNLLNRQNAPKRYGIKEFIRQNNHLLHTSAQQASKQSFKKKAFREVEERHVHRSDLLQIRYPVSSNGEIGSSQGYFIITGLKTRHSIPESMIGNVDVGKSLWSSMT